MIGDKELPSEYVSIRQVWLRGIDDCRKAISQVANIESSSERKDWTLAGPRTACHTIDALYLSLVNYGEALILDDVEKWREQKYQPKLDEIWEKKTKKQSIREFAGFPDDDDEDDENKMSIEQKWWANYRLSKLLYKEILAVLNKYNMLFPEPYKGFSNVEMKSL